MFLIYFYMYSLLLFEVYNFLTWLYKLFIMFSAFLLLAKLQNSQNADETIVEPERLES